MAERRVFAPAAVAPIGFAVFALLGAVVLGIVEDLGPVEALFTATSAVCVTGLTVVDTDSLSRTGQTIILALIQIGGLGTMTLGVLLVRVLGRRLSLEGESQFTGEQGGTGAGRLALIVGGFTLVIEGLGFLGLRGRVGTGDFDAMFLSVSAFCNAGFSPLAGSLAAHRDDSAVISVMLVLIFLGGLGFPVLRSLGRRLWRQKHRGPRFSLHTRLALGGSAVLLFGGALILMLLEGAGPGDALFLSVAGSRAGFQTMPMAHIGAAGFLILCLLMFVGGSPAGTAGGVKTTTFLLCLVAGRGLARRESIVMGGRTIPDDLVRRAISIVSASAAAVLVTALGLFVLTPPHIAGSVAPGAHGPFATLLFEAFSAVGTVGLSTGVTPHLTTPAHLLLVLAMWAGRVGPLSLALLAFDKGPAPMVTYPQERVLVG